jgi:DNA-binding transcriptional regulator LsrR (DeoR family)
MQIALIGIGNTKESAFFERGMLSMADGKKLRDAGVVGEICGRFYDRNGDECDTDFRERVISISLDDLRNIPEVVAITNGTDRTEAICAAIRGGLCKSLVIDDIGATALLACASS